ncbi:hypothetical protein E2P81_ATG11592 [Venturia nashicola]|nr:hypothetical protein E2P81_ATG11592 [Venturia nashicola]
MKFSTTILVQLLTVTVTVLAQNGPKKTDKPDPDKGMTREQAGHKIVAGGLAPKLQDLKSRYTDYYEGSKRTKVRYGPYSLPKMSSPSITALLTGEKGTMSTVSVGMTKPCTGKCNLLVAQAGLEYANGTEASMANGSWLHHIVVLATGPGRKDTVCPMLPGERFFSSGNERTPTSFGDVVEKKVKSTFPIDDSDGFQAEIELMNMTNEPRSVYLTIDYEYIPGPKPEGWKTAKAMWLDVTNCGISYVRPPSKQDFQLKSSIWTSPYGGEMLGVGGHLHDGGTHLDILINDKTICKSDAEYTTQSDGSPMSMGRRSLGRRDGPHGAGGAAPGTTDGKAHIREMSTCSMMGKINKGDKVHIEANYEFSKFPGMKATEIMGIAIMYAAMDV